MQTVSTAGIIALLLSSSVLCALINSFSDIVISKLKRKYAVEDREDDLKEKVDKCVSDIKDLNTRVDEVSERVEEYIKEHHELSKSIVKSNKLIMQGKIEYLGMKFIAEGQITHEHRKMLHEMWELYHYTWKGNGDLDLIMDAVDELPLKGV